MKYPVKKVASVVSATLLGLSISASVSAQSQSEQLSDLVPVVGQFTIVENQLPKRYIVKYKKTPGNSLMMSSGKVTFNSTSASTKLAQHGAEIKVELKEQHAIAAVLSKQAVQALLNSSDVESIELDQPRHLMAAYNDDVGDPATTQLTPYSIYQSQANLLNLQPGIKVCIIDSGIAGSNGETGGLNNDFNWSNITGSNDSGTGSWNADGGPHGTHVAGTVGAADNGFGVVGMAPGVAMHIVKVFNNDGWGYSSDLAQAATKCTEAGANIITMSLGGGASNSTEENAFNAFTNNGGLVLAAAGNDGNTTRSYPAGYDSIMMIGGNNSDNGRYEASQFPSCNTAKTNCVEATAGGLNVLSTYPSDGATVAGLSAGGEGYTSTAMENTGNVSGSTFNMGTAESTNSGANGKICMIDRGNISFHDKVKNCEDSGGIGAVIVNNVSGVLQGTLGTTNTTSIPAVGAALEDRTGLMASSTASISVGLGDYGLMSGTSMATPGVAGVAALVWSNHQSCTGTEIREVLKATAFDAGDAGHDVYYGNGIVKAKDASDYITANGCDGQGGPVDNVLPIASFTDTCTDLACSFDGSNSTDSDGSISSYAWSFGDGNSASGSTASHTYAADGTYSVQLTVTDNAGGTNVQTKSVTVSDTIVVPPSGSELSNGVTESGLTATTGNEIAYTMEVPAGATGLSFVIAGGSGDADLYVRFGSAATTSSYDCRPYKNGNSETCTISGVQAGTYHVMVRAYSTFSGLSLTGSYTEAPVGGEGGSAAVNDVAGARRAWTHYTIDVPAGMSSLAVNISGGSGDADMYVRQGAQPTSSTYDCRPYKSGNTETCNFSNPTAGTWHVSIYGYSAYSGVDLIAEWN